MTTKAKRARKKANRMLGRLEKAAQLLEEAAAHADDDVEADNAEDEKPERPASEKAAAMTALAAAKKMRKRLKGAG